MNNEIQEEIIQDQETSKKVDGIYTLPTAIIIAGFVIAGEMIYNAGNSSLQTPSAKQVSAAEEAVLPSGGVELPVIWGDLGSKLVFC